MNEKYPRPEDKLIFDGLDYLEKYHNFSIPNDQYSLIKNKLTPVIAQLKDLINEVANIVTEQRKDINAILRRFSITFIANDCPLFPDDTSIYTTEANLASIQYLNNKLVLTVNKKFNDISLQKDTTIIEIYLKELVHELAALLFIKQFEIDGGKIASQEILNKYKEMLIISNTKIALTHIVDAILLSVIQKKSK